MFDCRALLLNGNRTASALLVGCCTAFRCCKGYDRRRAPTGLDKHDLGGLRKELPSTLSGGMRDYGVDVYVPIRGTCDCSLSMGTKSIVLWLAAVTLAQAFNMFNAGPQVR
jgi:hypothetical protein